MLFTLTFIAIAAFIALATAWTVVLERERRRELTRQRELQRLRTRAKQIHGMFK